jgi:single-stranded-DNA-specific exonuclease
VTPDRPAGPPRPAAVWHDPPQVDVERIRALESELSLPRPLAHLLVARGFDAPDGVRSHLRPRLDHLSSPDDYDDLGAAADRIERAIRSGETILVHGDFDADGLCSSALLTKWLRRLGARVEPFVPHRTEHGYDLGPAGLAAARTARAGLIVTVDCGIQACDAIDQARASGLDVIVTDHHTPGASLPEAVAVVHPLRTLGATADPHLCGAGVAFQLVRHLAARAGVPDDELWPDLDLVAIATIADLVPLTGDNRVLVRFGLRALERTTKPGLLALLRRARVEAPIDAGQVGYRLAPRLNAVGRMGSPLQALDLLLTDDPDRAERLADEAEALNERRRAVDRQTSDEALRMLGDFDPEQTWGIVLAREGWHPGILGIAASRVREQVHRPTVLISLDGTRGRGSGRSIPALHLHEALTRCAPHLRSFGGHRQAAGLELERDRLDEFRAAFNDEARRQLEGRDLRPEWSPDMRFDLSHSTLDTVRMLQYLGPHGMANPNPLLLAEGLEVCGAPREVGEGHLKLELAAGAARRPAIGFGLARRFAPADLHGARLDALFELDINRWRGRSEVQLVLRDLRPASAPRPPAAHPDSAATPTPPPSRPPTRPPS